MTPLPAVKFDPKLDLVLEREVDVPRELLLEAQGTRYAAIGIHRDEAGRKSHEEMGFHDGWGKALDQLVALVKQM